MVWLPWKPHGDEEAGLKLGRLKPEQQAGPKRLVPWWVGAMRRAKAANVMRRQPKISAGGGGLRRRLAPAGPYQRRSVVKASFRRNRNNGGWVRNARYLARERAQREAECGRGFDGRREDLNMAAIVRGWECGDRLVWSLIVSPEDAARMDLRRHVRDLMAEMERDLGTRLEWVAIDHHNTANQHVHLLIRGIRENGRELTLDRDYISRGVRELSGELAERELGPRDEQEYLQTRGRSIQREYWTEIDRTLGRRAGLDRVVSYEDFEAFSEGARVRAEQEMERLAYLEKLGLARLIDERSWELSAEHEPELRRRQSEGDILRSRARGRQREQRERERGEGRER
jgi:type IV secretory pathway VirD2 relaxase